ncbi:nucleoside/nucleotide kinase family protein [Kitasatospora sp. NBC_00374]|uniref:nucleoside/nucleotide kinase family protein n=1 Tax=Kitasatospora sp. NBC_00374 TaxID=2975964 RepID=UPI0030E075A8
MHDDGDGVATTPLGTEPDMERVFETAVERALLLLNGRDGRKGRSILGIAGPPAAGKSTLARHVVAEVVRREGADAAAYLPLDGFHLSNPQLDRLGLRACKGAPETFDAWGYLALLNRVATERFRDVFVPDFDRDLDEPVAARHVVRPHTRLVVTEGNYLAVPAEPWQAARRLMSELWFVDAEETVRTERLLRRHQRGGGPREAAELRIAANDHPNAEYVKQGRAGCDWVVRTGSLPPDRDGRSVL